MANQATGQPQGSRGCQRTRIVRNNKVFIQRIGEYLHRKPHGLSFFLPAISTMSRRGDSRWSIGDIENIEDIIYKLNRGPSEDVLDKENFGWNSPIKYHRFATTPAASAKKNRKPSPMRWMEEHNNTQHHVHFSDESPALPQRRPPSPFSPHTSSQRQVNLTQPFSPYQQQRSATNLPTAPKFAALSTPASSVPTGASQVECDEFLVNAKKQLEIELARERSDTVVKLRKILQEGAKSHIEQKRREAVNRLVGQTDTILQHAREDILTEVYSLFSTSTTQYTTSIAPREHYNGKFRDVYKRIKVAEQENIKNRVQLSVQQVASHMLHEEAAMKERLATEQVVER